MASSDAHEERKRRPTGLAEEISRRNPRSAEDAIAQSHRIKATTGSRSGSILSSGLQGRYEGGGVQSLALMARLPGREAPLELDQEWRELKSRVTGRGWSFCEVEVLGHLDRINGGVCSCQGLLISSREAVSDFPVEVHAMAGPPGCWVVASVTVERPVGFVNNAGEFLELADHRAAAQALLSAVQGEPTVLTLVRRKPSGNWLEEWARHLSDEAPPSSPTGT